MQVQFIDFDFHISMLESVFHMLFIINGCSRFTALFADK